MKKFKKKTIALVLASVVTVVGAFAANNYKNSLTGLKFENSTPDRLNLVVQTKTLYDGNLTPLRKDANTYILTLPEINSVASNPDLSEVSSVVSSVNIRTMPYSNTAKGYTRITIKIQNPSLSLSTTNQVLLPEKIANNQLSSELYNEANNDSIVTKHKSDYSKLHQEENYYEEDEENLIDTEKTNNSNLDFQKDVSEGNPLSSVLENNVSFEDKEDEYTKSNSNYSSIYLFLWAFLIVLVSAFFYTKAKNKMLEIAGESLEIKLEDDKKTKVKNKKENKNLKKIKNAINTLDSAYSRSSYLPRKNEYKVLEQEIKKEEPEVVNVVDLDELFQEYKVINSEEEENQALEAFLSGFSYDDNIYQDIADNENEFDENLYENIINDESLAFTQNDINCIQELLHTEINDETIRNIENFAVSNPIKEKRNLNKVLEDLILEYTISQNIIFNQDDINIVNQLINVELDNDFVTNLRTNPEKRLEMEKEISEYSDNNHSKTENLTLKVKEMLPDLSEALRLQQEKKIEYKRKTEVIYANENYEIKTLAVNDELPNLAFELNNKDAYVSKPSAKYAIMDENYVVGDGELNVASSLPNLQEAISNPEKYKKEESVYVADPEELLARITDVSFKPFDDGKNNFEILNDFPTITDIQNEFKDFDGFEISYEDEIKVDNIQKDYDDFKSIYDDNYIDLDKNLNSGNKLEDKPKYIKSSIDNSGNPKKLQEIKKNENLKPVEQKKLESQAMVSDIKLVKCIFEGRSYEILSSVTFDDDKGCYLAKDSSGYTILAYIGENLKEIQRYQNLKSEKIHAKVNEKTEDKTLYLLRIGLQKLIISVVKDDINFVMNL